MLAAWLAHGMRRAAPSTSTDWTRTSCPSLSLSVGRGMYQCGSADLRVHLLVSDKLVTIGVVKIALAAPVIGRVLQLDFGLAA